MTVQTEYSKRDRAPWEDDPIDTSKLPSGWTDVLIALIERGPLDDGDIPSKSARDALLKEGLAARVIINQKEAGNVATYYGRELYEQLVDAWPLEEAIKKRQSKSLTSE